MSDHVYTKLTTSTNKQALLAVIDVLIVTFIISILVGSYWGGTWMLLDAYLLPDNFELSAWISFIIGNVTFIPVSLFQDDLQAFVLSFDKNFRFVKFFFFSRIYNYILAFAAVNQWRGSAYLIVNYVGNSLTSDLICLFIGVISLCLSGTFRSVIIPPLGSATDVNEEYQFFIQTRFCKPARSIRFILDTLFTVLIINTFVVFFWKGAWFLLQDHIFPAKETFSAMSIPLLTFFAFYLIPLIGQYEVRRILKRLDRKSKVLKILVKYIFFIFCSFLPVMFWHGVVLVQDYLIFQDYPIIGSWLCHVIGFAGLTLLMASNSLIPRGCFIDSGNEYDVMFDLKYVIPVLEYCKKLRN